MIKAKRVRLFPTKEQEQKLWQSAGTARFVYNWTIERQEASYSKEKRHLSHYELRKELTQLKQEKFSWMKEVSANIPKQAVKDACLAYERFFQKLGDKPHYKKKKSTKPGFYNDSQRLKVREREVLLEKIGWVTIKPGQLAENRYMNPRITFDGKYWYLTVGVETEQEPVLLTDETIGIDVGLRRLAVCSNGMIYENINRTPKVRRLEKRLRRYYGQLERKYRMNRYKETDSIKKLMQEIHLLKRRLRNIRINHLHQTTNDIVKTKPSKVVIEDLDIRQMRMNQKFSPSVSRQYLGTFRKLMEYKCEIFGIELICADRGFPSTKKCHVCGNYKQDFPLGREIYVCGSCGETIDRDLNAALNLARYCLV